MKLRVVSIDDNKLNLMLLESMLSNMEDVSIVSFLQPLEALEYCRSNPYDLILVDYMMPDMDGITFIKEIRNSDHDIPIIMITAVDDDDTVKLNALEAGATEFLNKPLKLFEFQVRVRNLLTLRKNQILLQNKAALLQREVEQATLEIVNREKETLAILGRASEFKDMETGQHISRVARYARIIGSEFLSDDELNTLYNSAPLHDVGKIGIPDAVLLKPGKLDYDEFELMKTHAMIGHDLLEDSNSIFLKAGAVIAATHHEKWDGTGYPKGLKGEGIALMGRIVAVCDVFDALLSTRPYKKAWEFDAAVNFVRDNSGSMFDPQVVDSFIKHLDLIKEVFENYRDE